MSGKSVAALGTGQHALRHVPEGEQTRDSSPHERQVTHQRRDDRGADHEDADESR